MVPVTTNQIAIGLASIGTCFFDEFAWESRRATFFLGLSPRDVSHSLPRKGSTISASKLVPHSYPLVMTNVAIEAMAIDIVDFPI
jgi:hypothetical protein